MVVHFDRLITGTTLSQGVVVFNVWSPAGHVLNRPDQTLIGRRSRHPASSMNSCRGGS
jgi:hypothetical protein